MKWVYAALCVVGTVLPYATAIPFRFLSAAGWLDAVTSMGANPAAAFAGADLAVSIVVFWAFVYRETRRQPLRWWWLCLIANLTVGLSLAFPLYLLLRELARERAA